MSLSKINGVVKITSLGFNITSETLRSRLQSMMIQIEQVNDAEEEEKSTSKMRVISLKEIITTPMSIYTPDKTTKFRTVDEKAKMLSSLIYLAMPELWIHDRKIAEEVNNWNFGPPTWGQIKQLELWRLLKIKKIRPTPAGSRCPPYTNSFHRLYTLTRGLLQLDAESEQPYKKVTWQWLMERANYEAIMIFSL